MMNLFAVSGLLIFLTSSAMAGFMFFAFRKSKNKLHLLWSIFCVSVAIWGGGGYKIATTANIYLADAWWRITHIGIIFIPILFTHFVYTFLNLKRKKILISLYILGIFFLITNFTGDLFIANMRWVFNQFYYDSPPGIFYVPFTIMFFGLVIYTHTILWLACRKVEGVQKSQIKYFLVGMGVSFFGGSLSFFPVYKIDIYPVLNLFVCLYPLIIAYAITRFRLMDIRIAIRKSAVYFLAAIFSYGFFYFSAWLLTRLFGDIYAGGALFFGIFIAMCFVSLFFLVEKIINIIANKYFFAALYNQHETLKKLSEKITSVVDLKKLIADITNVLKKELFLEKAAFVFKIDDDGFKILQNAGFDKRMLKDFFDINEITNCFSKNHKSLTLEELDNKKYGVLKESLEKIEANLLLPLICNNKLQGVIILGKKLTNDAYSQEDIGLLASLAHQAALAIENAKLYDKLEEWNDTLKDKVAEQTKDIRKKNVTLKKLLNLKTEFLHTASHQLRTPVSAIKGLVSMLKDGDFEKEEKEIKDRAFEGIFNKTEKMTNILDDILIAAELDTEENYKIGKLGKVDIAEVTEAVVKELGPLAREKGVGVELRIKNQEVRMGNKEQELRIKNLELRGGIGKQEIRNWKLGEGEQGGSVSAGMADMGEAGASKNPPQPLLRQAQDRLFEKGGRDHPLSPVCPAGSRPPLKKGVSLSQGGVFVLSSEINLRHILRNLLNNAIVYSRRGGEVQLKIKSEKLKIGEQGVVWSVRDNGIGVPKKNQKYLFEKFKRGENANTKNCDGSGLGLFIVKKLVKAHPGAEYGFESKEGEGSEFWVKFSLPQI